MKRKAPTTSPFFAEASNPSTDKKQKTPSSSAQLFSSSANKTTSQKPSSSDASSHSSPIPSSLPSSSSSNNLVPSDAKNHSADDPYQLEELFHGGAESWFPILKPIVEAESDVKTFIAPKRPKTIVPLRELTFQALKPNPPEKWKIIIFGQNPYPRVESATGIAMFDNTFSSWSDKRFGKVTSMRCIMKAACVWKHHLKGKTTTDDIRKLLTKHKTVQPPEWFQAMLTQGCLLLNAGLTSSTDKSVTTTQHTKFWRKVVERIIEEILKAKAKTDDETLKGAVFAWWGSHARSLRAVVDKFAAKYKVAVEHVDHCNPAAMADAFCNGNHFGDVNQACERLGMETVNWLPSVGWDGGKSPVKSKLKKAGKGAAGAADQTQLDDDAAFAAALALAEEEGEGGHSDDEKKVTAAAADDRKKERRHESKRMASFIAETIDLHRMFLERLQGVKDEQGEELHAITGIADLPLLSLADACKPLRKLVKGVENAVQEADTFAAKRMDVAGQLTKDEVGALYLYTTASGMYKALNANLRDPDRSQIKPFMSYLRLFGSAQQKLEVYSKCVFRGVSLDLKAQYKQGTVVTWWGVSSCTSKLSVAQGFLGSSGKRTLFEVQPRSAVSICKFSAFTGEDEYILPPGTQLKVVSVKSQSSLTTIKLEEIEGDRQVS